MASQYFGNKLVCKEDIYLYFSYCISVMSTPELTLISQSTAWTTNMEATSRTTFPSTHGLCHVHTHYLTDYTHLYSITTTATVPVYKHTPHTSTLWSTRSVIIPEDTKPFVQWLCFCFPRLALAWCSLRCLLIAWPFPAPWLWLWITSFYRLPSLIKPDIPALASKPASLTISQNTLKNMY